MGEPVQIPLFNVAGEPAGSMVAPAAFTESPNRHVIYLAVLKQLANARVGTASTKTKGEVSGGGKKPWRQKGTGRARQGSIRAPQWAGGGIVFGPRPRKYTADLPVRVRRLAMRSVLSGKIASGQIKILDGLKFDKPKTREAAALLKRMEAKGRTLLVLPTVDAEMGRAFRNIPGVRVVPAGAVSVYDILSFRNVIVLKDALAILAGRAGAKVA
jgi:large subunit ribosomal protein L4